MGKVTETVRFIWQDNGSLRYFVYGVIPETFKDIPLEEENNQTNKNKKIKIPLDGDRGRDSSFSAKVEVDVNKILAAILKHLDKKACRKAKRILIRFVLKTLKRKII